jgi:hypothetical protein
MEHEQPSLKRTSPQHRTEAPAVRWVPIAQLRPNPRNPRAISTHQLTNLRRSMEQDPAFLSISERVFARVGKCYSSLPLGHAHAVRLARLPSRCRVPP